MEVSMKKREQRDDCLGRERDVFAKRDVINFIRLRDGEEDDDLAIAGLLIVSFTETYAAKLTSVKTDEQRVLELTRIANRRRDGIVRVMELGLRIIGTYSLL